MAHTPGPWTVESADWPDGPPGIVRYYVRHDPPVINVPNARLIAAAPDLLAALQAFSELTRFRTSDYIEIPVDEWADAIDRAIAALTAAEGRQP
jgi:hypothetical protein